MQLHLILIYHKCSLKCPSNIFVILNQSSSITLYHIVHIFIWDSIFCNKLQGYSSFETQPSNRVTGVKWSHQRFCFWQRRVACLGNLLSLYPFKDMTSFCSSSFLSLYQFVNIFAPKAFPGYRIFQVLRSSFISLLERISLSRCAQHKSTNTAAGYCNISTSSPRIYFAMSSTLYIEVSKCWCLFVCFFIIIRIHASPHHPICLSR